MKKCTSVLKCVLLVIFVLTLSLFFISCGESENKESDELATPTAPAVDSDSVTATEEGITVTSDRLKVEVSQPGKDYTAKRFDWGAIVKQVTLDGKHTFLSTEDSKYEYKPALGYGIIAQFEPAFSRSGEGDYVVTTDENTNSVVFTKDLPADDKGRGNKIVKIVTVDGNKLSIKSSITNYGDKAINFGEYNHNFSIIDKKPVSGDYELEFGFTPIIKKSPVTGGDLFSLDGNVLTWSKELEGSDEYLCQMDGFENVTKDFQWKLTHKPTGASIKVSGDFDISKVQLWGKIHTICPEIFLTQKVEPNETFEWTRTYEFDA